MSPVTAFILGILVVLIPLLIFYVLSIEFSQVNSTWDNIFCNQ